MNASALSSRRDIRGWPAPRSSHRGQILGAGDHSALAHRPRRSNRPISCGGLPTGAMARARLEPHRTGTQAAGSRGWVARRNAVIA